MSSHELEARIKKIEDIEEIKKLQYTYAYLIDTRQFHRVPDLFADDFVAEWGFAGPFTKKEDLREFFTGPIAATLAMSAHQMLAQLRTEMYPVYGRSIYPSGGLSDQRDHTVEDNEAITDEVLKRIGYR